jgi:dTDP-4-dehydrorhamnose reductase
MIEKILLLGSTGMLGTYIYSWFSKKCFPIIKVNYRITDDKFCNLENILLESGLNDKTCVINCIGLIPQRNISADKSKYMLVNGLFPNALWLICKKYNAQMIQPSTDCVFSGAKGKYIETDIHDEVSDYGLSKSAGEPDDCTIIRCSIIGLELKNFKSFVQWVINSVRSKEKISGWDNHLWNGITCLEYCKLINYIVTENKFWKGVQHIYSPDTLSKYQMACLIVKTFCPDINIDNAIIKTEAQIPIDKTLQSVKPFNFPISKLSTQIVELKNFSLIE